MVAEHHADAGIDNFGVHAIAILVGHPRLGIPPATMEIVKLREPCRGRETFGGNTRGSNETHRDGLLHSIDDVGIAALLLEDDARRGVFVLLIDARDVGIGRLHDVRVG